MLRVARLTDYACILMSCMTSGPDDVASASELAVRSRLELPTVSKLMKRLHKAGLVKSFRGAQGGYRLARPAASITLADIVAAMEGPIGMTECSVHSGRCSHESHCGARSNWRRVSVILVEALTAVTLSDIRPPAIPLQSAARAAALPLQGR